MRIAAIDVGSNSIHLAVVEADGPETQRVLARDKVMAGLGQGLALSGRIEPLAFEAGLAALARMKARIDSLGCDSVLAHGTAALRDASNAAEFVAGAKRLDIDIQVISGEEEARLIYQAVAQAYPFPEGPVVLVDIGGGSTELTWVERGRALASHSLPWGLQRLAAAFPTEDPPTIRDYERVRKSLRDLLREAGRSLPRALPQAQLMLGTSGTLEDLTRAANDSEIVTRAEVKALRTELWELPAKRRVIRLQGVAPRRAEALHVGALWTEVLMGWTGAEMLRHLPVGLREGMVWEALRHGGHLIPPLAERRWASVEAFAARTDPDPAHTAHVQGLADQLFIDLQPVFELGEQEREWLACAARLHDIGFAVAERNHHKHGEYMILNGDLKGFWPQELSVLSQVVRHHRGKAPDPARHEAFAALEPWHQALVLKLAAILRLADALDRRRDQRIAKVNLRRVKDEWVLRVQRAEAGSDLSLEAEAVVEKGRLLERLLGHPIRWALNGGASQTKVIDP